MFNKIKKMLFGLLACATLLFVAGCQNQPSESKTQNTPQQESWEWTEQPLTMQKILMDTYVKNNFEGLKEAVKKYQHAKVTTDDANLSYDYSLTGEIDKEKHTITFPETPTFLKALVMGIGIDPLKPITYNYTVDGNQMTLFIEGDIQEGYPREMRIRFNRLGGQ